MVFRINLNKICHITQLNRLGYRKNQYDHANKQTVWKQMVKREMLNIFHKDHHDKAMVEWLHFLRTRS